MARFHVHIYAIVRVMVPVEADSAAAALPLAHAAAELDHLFAYRELSDGRVLSFAEDVTDYLVDCLNGRDETIAVRTFDKHHNDTTA